MLGSPAPTHRPSGLRVDAATAASAAAAAGPSARAECTSPPRRAPSNGSVSAPPHRGHGAHPGLKLEPDGASASVSGSALEPPALRSRSRVVGLGLDLGHSSSPRAHSDLGLAAQSRASTDSSAQSSEEDAPRWTPTVPEDAASSAGANHHAVSSTPIKTNQSPRRERSFRNRPPGLLLDFDVGLQLDRESGSEKNVGLDNNDGQTAWDTGTSCQPPMRPHCLESTERDDPLTSFSRSLDLPRSLQRSPVLPSPHSATPLMHGAKLFPNRVPSSPNHVNTPPRNSAYNTPLFDNHTDDTDQGSNTAHGHLHLAVDPLEPIPKPGSASPSPKPRGAPTPTSRLGLGAGLGLGFGTRRRKPPTPKLTLTSYRSTFSSTPPHSPTSIKDLPESAPSSVSISSPVSKPHPRPTLSTTRTTQPSRAHLARTWTPVAFCVCMAMLWIFSVVPPTHLYSGHGWTRHDVMMLLPHALRPLPPQVPWRLHCTSQPSISFVEGSSYAPVSSSHPGSEAPRGHIRPDPADLFIAVMSHPTREGAERRHRIRQTWARAPFYPAGGRGGIRRDKGNIQVKFLIHFPPPPSPSIQISPDHDKGKHTHTLWWNPFSRLGPPTWHKWSSRGRWEQWDRVQMERELFNDLEFLPSISLPASSSGSAGTHKDVEGMAREKGQKKVKINFPWLAWLPWAGSDASQGSTGSMTTKEEASLMHSLILWADQHAHIPIVTMGISNTSATDTQTLPIAHDIHTQHQGPRQPQVSGHQLKFKRPTFLIKTDDSTYFLPEQLELRLSLQPQRKLAVWGTPVSFSNSESALLRGAGEHNQKVPSPPTREGRQLQGIASGTWGLSMDLVSSLARAPPTVWAGRRTEPDVLQGWFSFWARVGGGGDAGGSSGARRWEKTDAQDAHAYTPPGRRQEVKIIPEKCWMYDHPLSGSAHAHGFIFPPLVSTIKEEARYGLSRAEVDRRGGPGRYLSYSSVVDHLHPAHAVHDNLGGPMQHPDPMVRARSMVEGVQWGRSDGKNRSPSPGMSETLAMPGSAGGFDWGAGSVPTTQTNFTTLFKQSHPACLQRAGTDAKTGVGMYYIREKSEAGMTCSRVDASGSGGGLSQQAGPMQGVGVETYLSPWDPAVSTPASASVSAPGMDRTGERGEVVQGGTIAVRRVPDTAWYATALALRGVGSGWEAGAGGQTWRLVLT